MTGKRNPPNRKASERKGRGGLSPEDRRLWQHVAEQAKPLSGRDRLHSDAVEQVKEDLKRTAGPPPLKPRKSATVCQGKVVPRVAAKPAPAPLSHGSHDGLDRRKAERLSRGKLPIEATLDLHGLRQAEAHRRLERFLAECQALGKRCVLVVTGKGVHKEEGGVLRANVPRWLNEAPNRARVLSFDYAQQKHGGTGALYVLLRRKR